MCACCLLTKHQEGESRIWRREEKDLKGGGVQREIHFQRVRKTEGTDICVHVKTINRGMNKQKWLIPCFLLDQYSQIDPVITQLA